MINQKEYSDLPDKQKLIYIKRGIIINCFRFVPFLIIIAVGFQMMYGLAELQREDDNIITPVNQTSLEQATEDAKVDLEDSLLVFGFMIIFLLVIFSVLEAGTNMGRSIANKLKLYTDLDLENAEKELAKIKGVLK